MFVALVFVCEFARARVHNIYSYGAVGDGLHIDTKAINDAIEAASADSKGIVLIPRGEYACHSIHLKSNITIRFEDGAVIKAAEVDDVHHYDSPEPFYGKTYQDFGHSHWQNSLIWGIGLSNITIEGKGLIDGTSVLSMGHGRVPLFYANKAIALKDCRNVRIKDITMLQCGHFAMLLTGVDNLQINGVIVDTNRDGFDIDCCENVKVQNCVVNTFNDDAIVLKCSYALGRMKPTQNVVVENCRVSGYDIGTLYDGTMQKNNLFAVDRDGPTGRIKLGTESNSAFRNITIRNCHFEHCRGLALETVDGALLENIIVKNITMNDICNSPIYMVLGTRMRAPKGTSDSRFRNVKIKNLVATDCDSRYAILLSGQPGNMLENIVMKDIDISFRGGLSAEDVLTQKGANDFFQKHAPGYPEPSAHGIQPAWGISAKHIRGLKFNNVKLRLMNPDGREALRFENVDYKGHVSTLFPVD